MLLSAGGHVVAKQAIEYMREQGEDIPLDTNGVLGIIVHEGEVVGHVTEFIDGAHGSVDDVLHESRSMRREIRRIGNLGIHVDNRLESHNCVHTDDGLVLLDLSLDSPRLLKRTSMYPSEHEYLVRASGSGLIEDASIGGYYPGTYSELKDRARVLKSNHEADARNNFTILDLLDAKAAVSSPANLESVQRQVGVLDSIHEYVRSAPDLAFDESSLGYTIDIEEETIRVHFPTQRGEDEVGVQCSLQFPFAASNSLSEWKALMQIRTTKRKDYVMTTIDPLRQEVSVRGRVGRRLIDEAGSLADTGCIDPLLLPQVFQNAITSAVGDVDFSNSPGISPLASI